MSSISRDQKEIDTLSTWTQLQLGRNVFSSSPSLWWCSVQKDCCSFNMSYGPYLSLKDNGVSSVMILALCLPDEGWGQEN